MKPLFLTLLLCITCTSLYPMDPPPSESPTPHNEKSKTLSNEQIIKLLKKLILHKTITFSRIDNEDFPYTITFPARPLVASQTVPVNQHLTTHNRQLRIPLLIGTIGVVTVIGGVLYSLRRQDQEEGTPSFFSSLSLGIQALLAGSNAFDWNIVLESLQHDEGAIASIGAGAITSIGLLVSFLRRPPSLTAVPIIIAPTHIPGPYADTDLEALYQRHLEPNSNLDAVINQAFATTLERAVFVGDQQQVVDIISNQKNNQEVMLRALKLAKELGHTAVYDYLIQILGQSLTTELEKAVLAGNQVSVTRMLVNEGNNYTIPVLKRAMELANALGHTEFAKQLETKHGKIVRRSFRSKKNKKKNKS